MANAHLLADYPAKGRATGGVATIDQKSLGKIGMITVVRVVQEADDLTMMSANGVVLRTRVTGCAQIRPGNTRACIDQTPGRRQPGFCGAHCCG